MLPTRERISIGVLAVYCVLFPLAVLTAVRHGFGRQLGWFVLCIFCALRIASSAVGIVSAKNPENKDDAAWALILLSVGLSPLLIATDGILARVVGTIDNTAMQRHILRFTRLPAILALVLGIVGGTDLESKSANTVKTGQDLLKASIILFLVVWLIIAVMALLTLKDIRQLVPSESRLLIAVLISLPLIFVRLVYGLISDFGHDAKFQQLNGDPYVQLGMTLIEEILVVITFLTAGLMAEKLEESGKPGRRTARV